MLSLEVLQGLLLPFMGTALGAAGVYVLKDELNPLVQKGLMGFAAGVLFALVFAAGVVPREDLVLFCASSSCGTSR